MPENDDLALLTGAARGAAEIALRHWNGENRVWHKRPGDPVSDADIAVDTYLRKTLLAARPDYGWLSEETEDDGARLERKRVFVVDPIDGTRSFVAGERTWAHSLAVVDDGEPVAAVVLLPLRESLYAAARGGAATRNSARIRCANPLPDATPSILANNATFDPVHWPGGTPDAERAFRPSLAYRLCLVAEGRFDAMVTFRDSWEWDVAAGALIAACAGASVTDRDGERLSFNRHHPAGPGLMAAAPETHARLLAARRSP